MTIEEAEDRIKELESEVLDRTTERDLWEEYAGDLWTALNEANDSLDKLDDLIRSADTDQIKEPEKPAGI